MRENEREREKEEGWEVEAGGRREGVRQSCCAASALKWTRAIMQMLCKCMPMYAQLFAMAARLAVSEEEGMEIGESFLQLLSFGFDGIRIDYYWWLFRSRGPKYGRRLKFKKFGIFGMSLAN